MMGDEIESELFSARVLNKLGPHSKKEKKTYNLIIIKTNKTIGVPISWKVLDVTQKKTQNFSR